jgi:AraC family transcriptional regulator
MEKAIEQAVGRVIATMRENLGEPLTVDDMARTAMFSKFHFSRFFQRVTGVSPRRFLSALRLHEAKHLLVHTTLTFTDISHRVGYTSVGTFSYRFTASVGVSPTIYRQLNGDLRATGTHHHPAPPARTASIHGQVHAAGPDHLGLIFIGLFADPIPRGQPVRCTILHRTGPYRLANIPYGNWYLLAHSLAAGLEHAVHDPPAAGRTLCLGSHGPVRIAPGTPIQHADLRLEPTTPSPPVLQALLDIRSPALTVSAA